MRVATIKTNLKDFFYHWVTVTYPIHKLGKMDRIVLAELLYYHHKISQTITSDEYVQKVLFDYDTKLKMAENAGINQRRFAMILTSLRKKGIIKGKTLNLAYTPGLEKDGKEFTFAYRFKIVENDDKGKDSKKNAKASSKA